MNLIDAPKNSSFRIRIVRGMPQHIGTKIGQCVYMENDLEYPTVLVGFTDNGGVISINEALNYGKYFSDDPPRYRDTILFISLEELKRSFTSCYWAPGITECELLDEHIGQVCNVCKVSAPHGVPNKDNVFVCDVCSLQLSL